MATVTAVIKPKTALQSKLPKLRAIPTLFFSREARRNFFLRALLILAEEGWGALANPELGWRLQKGWPYYFLQRRDGGHLRTQSSAGAYRGAGLIISCRGGTGGTCQPRARLAPIEGLALLFLVEGRATLLLVEVVCRGDAEGRRAGLD